MNYKKGDWVVFPDYNKYPVQLENDEALGFMDYLWSGCIFVELSLDEAKEAGVNLILAVRDPRSLPGHNPRHGWVDSCKVRLATKKDFQPLLKAEKDSIRRANKAIKMYGRAMKSL
jgi:hypothetical protein